MRFNKLVFTLGALGLVIFPTISTAAVVIYNYTAKVSSIFTTVADSGVYTDLSSGVLPAATIDLGSTISGQFSYDTATQPYIVGPSYALYANPLNSFSLTFIPSGLKLSSSSSIGIVSGGSNYKSYQLGTSGSDVRAWVGFTDINSNTGLMLPQNLSLSSLLRSEVVYVWQPAGSSTKLFISGDLTTITRVSAVPEPESWAMLGMGAALIAGVARRRQRRDARLASK